MSRSGAEDITIDRLRVSGDKRAAHSLARELEQESWSLHLPANRHNAWIFVRELQISGNQRLLRQQTAQQLAALIARAVDGRHANANAAEVCFTSLSELLAFLLRDLALGQAAGKWYWQHWSYLLRISRAQAIAELLCENPAELPAVMEQLAALGQLPRVWQFVSAATADTIVRRLASYYHIPLPLLTVTANSPADQPILQSAQRQFQQHKTALQGWQPLLITLHPDDIRWVLAALISGITHCPLLVIRRPSAVVNAFKAQFDESHFAQDKPAPPLVAATNSSEHTLANLVEDTQHSGNSPTLLSNRKDSTITTPGNAANEQNSPAAAAKSSAPTLAAMVVKPTISQPIAAFLPQNSPIVVLPSADEQVVPAGELPPMMESYEPIQSPPTILPVNPHFMTQLGGFFYMINALRAILTPAFLARQSLASGWLWLFDCGRLWAGRLGLELDQPLLGFVALTIGYDDHQSLAAQPIFPESLELFTELEQCLSAQALWADAGALAIPAHVTADASHIDVFYALNAVRLDIRLAGLDVNPGWVPWLGRVVTFHYIESVLQRAEHHAG